MEKIDEIISLREEIERGIANEYLEEIELLNEKLEFAEAGRFPTEERRYSELMQASGLAIDKKIALLEQLAGTQTSSLSYPEEYKETRNSFYLDRTNCSKVIGNFYGNLNPLVNSNIIGWGSQMDLIAENATQAGRFDIVWNASIPVPNTGWYNIILGRDIILQGETWVRSKNGGNFTSSTKSSINTDLWIIIQTGSRLLDMIRVPKFANDSTKSANRKKAFNKTYTLTPSKFVYLNKNEYLSFTIRLAVNAWSNKNGYTRMRINNFGVWNPNRNPWPILVQS